MRTKIIKSSELEFKVIFLDGKYLDVLRYLKKRGRDDIEIESFWEGFCIENEDELIIWVKNKNINTVVHEVCHAILKILQYKNIFYSEDTSEIFSYFMGYYAKEGCKFYNIKK